MTFPSRASLKVTKKTRSLLQNLIYFTKRIQSLFTVQVQVAIYLQEKERFSTVSFSKISV